MRVMRTAGIAVSVVVLGPLAGVLLEDDAEVEKAKKRLGNTTELIESAVDSGGDLVETGVQEVKDVAGSTGISLDGDDDSGQDSTTTTTVSASGAGGL